MDGLTAGSDGTCTITFEEVTPAGSPACSVASTGNLQITAIDYSLVGL